jgi:hypothetical protein
LGRRLVKVATGVELLGDILSIWPSEQKSAVTTARAVRRMTAGAARSFEAMIAILD